MISSGVFWLVLLATVVIFWLLPARLRIAFLAAASAAYVIWYSFDVWKRESWVYRCGGLWLLGFCVLFYNLAPLARRKRTTLAPVGAAAGSARQIGGPSSATALLEKPAPAPKPHRWVLPALLACIIIYLLMFKYADVLKYICPPLAKYIYPRYTTHKPGGPPSVLMIPLGISYFTFKFIHYAIETARGAIKDRSPWQFLCWIYLFPAFASGPIERFDHFLANQDSRLRPEAIGEGLLRIICGLIKTYVIGEMLLSDCTGWYHAASNPNLLRPAWEPSSLNLWGLAIVSYLYLYVNFSGYCDIAIGAARLFGIRIMENFDWPIFSQNIGTFWKRWHMTLAGWCQSYIYMPMLGLTRSTVVALFATFITIGLWHQGSIPWLSWGLYNAIGIYIFQLWSRLKRKRKWTALDRAPWNFGGIALTFLFVAAGEVLTFACVSTGPNMAMRAYDMLRLMAKLVFIRVGP